jgi:hypothetical protein
MANVALTDYEIEQDRLPPVCARCGKPADERVEHRLRIIDGWRGIPQVVGMLLGLFFFPPLLFFTLRFARSIVIKVPLCARHADFYRRRTATVTRYLLPAWTVATVLMNIAVIIEIAVDGKGIACYGLFLVLIFVLFGAAFIERGLVRVTRPKEPGARLSNLHPEFVVALTEDRARDRVDNPDRRGGFGDVRDDYEDGPD